MLLMVVARATQYIAELENRVYELQQALAGGDGSSGGGGGGGSDSDDYNDYVDMKLAMTDRGQPPLFMAYWLWAALYLFAVVADAVAA